MRRAGFVLAMAAIMVVAATGSAQAASVQALGPSSSAPSALTDDAGTLHVAWETPRPPGGPGSVSYCRVVRAGSPACKQIGGFPDFVFDVFLLRRPQDGVLFLIVSGSDARGDHVTYALSSGDGGGSWSAPALVGTGLFSLDAARLTPDGRFADTVDDSSDALRWQRVPLGGGTETRSILLGSTSGFSDDAAPMFFGGQPALLGSGSAESRFRVLRAGRDAYLGGSWTPWSAAPRLRSTGTNVTQGPRGTFALTHGSVLSGQKLRIYRLRHRRWRPMRRHNVVATQLVGPYGRDFEQDARGRLFVAYAGRCAHGRWCIRVRRARAHHPFGRVRVRHLPKRAALPEDLSVAVNSRGRGWLAWRPGGTPDGQIQVAPLP